MAKNENLNFILSNLSQLSHTGDMLISVKRAIFSISDNAYYSNASVLFESLRNHETTADLFNFSPSQKVIFSDASIISLSISELRLTHEDFLLIERKTNVIEIATALKPFAFQFLQNLGYESVIYLDPDIYVLSNFDSLFLKHPEIEILLTPHRYGPVSSPRGKYLDLDLLSYGVFNLGFLRITTSPLTRDMLSWWSERTLHFSGNNRFDREFTDQKWMNLVTLYFRIQVVRLLGVNVAPWNLDENHIHKIDGKYAIDEANPLIFIHFSQQSHLLKDGNLNYRWYETLDLSQSECSESLKLVEEIAHSYNNDLGRFLHRLQPSLPRKKTTSLRHLFYTRLYKRSFAIQGFNKGFREDLARLTKRLISIE